MGYTADSYKPTAYNEGNSQTAEVEKGGGLLLGVRIRDLRAMKRCLLHSGSNLGAGTIL